MKVFVVGADHMIRQMYTDQGFEVITDLEKADIVQFIGGADVDPSLYGEHKMARTNIQKSADERDKKAWRDCSPKQMKVGICRGGQFLNIMNGGWMWQHVSGHAVYSGHKLHDVLFNREIQVTSTHHQMMIPAKDGAEVLGFAQGIATDLATAYPGGRVHNGLDTEVVWYERSNSLCFQPHPEYNQFPDCKKYFFDLIQMLKP